MKILISILVLFVSGCADMRPAVSDEDPRNFSVPPPANVGTASGYGVQKIRDGGVTCYVTEKRGYSGGGISCIGYAPE